MAPYEQTITALRLNEQEDNYLYCKLFADDVPKHICSLRKRELNGRGEFNCVGCNWAMS